MSVTTYHLHREAWVGDNATHSTQEPSKFHGECICGWKGPDRDYPWDAQVDIRGHMEDVDEPDNQ